MSKRHNTLITNAPALALMVTLLSALPGWSAEIVAKQRPQLIVSIMVDGLRGDYLDLLSEYFGPDGFNKLLKGGVTFDEVDYGPGVDAAGAVAILYTGAEPAVSGIAGATTYSTERKIELPTLLDASKIGNYTDETLSPAAIRVSTLGDEIRIDGAGASYVHAISPDAARAIIMGGHAGNSAFWLNEANGQWATTTHYPDVPTPITARNFTQPLSLRIDTLTWTPSLAVADYPALPAHKRYYPFRHTFTGQNRYAELATAAPINREVTDLADEYIRTMRLGARDAMDMLSVGYTLAPFPGSTDTGARLETMDAYLKLDREIARLLKAAEESGRTVVLLAGTPAPAISEEDDPKWKLNTGEFSTRKALSLLNMYLIARYGNGEWVTDYNRGAFYLNHKLIDSNNLNAEDVRDDAAKFLMRMSGVANAYTIDDIHESRRSEAERRNTVATSAADVYVEVNPGWVLVDDYTNAANPQRRTIRANTAMAPAILYAPEILEPQHISTPIDARRIAPTVARILRIRSPNGAALPPLSQIFHKNH
ncbi:MAG: alkaline phosphatase family protein [Bacteroides sp.]|nr:alkaline phosphatase family protein [Bacteroides sp.]MCM1378604.1 alkaline phosphatase family protein [Bacteroides sp.]MCM1444905.1 alkaline phosphatase family protein [Prevotella sp.]